MARKWLGTKYVGMSGVGEKIFLQKITVLGQSWDEICGYWWGCRPLASISFHSERTQAQQTDGRTALFHNTALYRKDNITI